jgi:hypothetical protein
MAQGWNALYCRYTSWTCYLYLLITFNQQLSVNNIKVLYLYFRQIYAYLLIC